MASTNQVSTPGSAAKGSINLVYMGARTRGVKYNTTNSQYTAMPIVQNFNITPKMTATSIGEFGTPNNVITVQDYMDCEVAFDIYETDIFYLYAGLMDVDPNQYGNNGMVTQNVMMEMPEMFYKNPLFFFGNQTHQLNGNIMTGFVVTDVSISEASETQDFKGNKKIAFKGTGTMYRKVLGGAVDYIRGNGAGVLFPTPYGKTFSGNVVTTNYTPVSVPLPGSNVGSTSAINYCVALQNSVVMPPTGQAPWSISGTSFILTNAPATTDFWDVFVPVAAHAPYSAGPT
jgi:hypothetical protein